jgi:hypothetical protein
MRRDGATGTGGDDTDTGDVVHRNPCASDDGAGSHRHTRDARSHAAHDARWSPCLRECRVA